MKKRKKGRWNPENKKYSDDDRKKVIKYFKTHNENSDRNIAEALGYDQSFVCTTLIKYWNKVQLRMKESRKKENIKNEFKK